MPVDGMFIQRQIRQKDVEVKCKECGEVTNGEVLCEKCAKPINLGIF